MSRMGEWAAEQAEQYDRDIEAAELDHYQQELARDPAFLAWLDKLNAERRKELNNGTHGESKI